MMKHVILSALSAVILTGCVDTQVATGQATHEAGTALTFPAFMVIRTGVVADETATGGYTRTADGRGTLSVQSGDLGTCEGDVSAESPWILSCTYGDTITLSSPRMTPDYAGRFVTEGTYNDWPAQVSFGWGNTATSLAALTAFD